MTDERGRTLFALEAEVGALIQSTRKVIHRRATMVHPELTGRGYVIVSRLLSGGPARASAVAAELHVDRGAISRQVQQLIGLGLVTKTTDPDDGRASLLEITDSGRERMAEVSRIRSAVLQDEIGDWADAEVAEFVALLRRYNQVLARAAVR